MPVTVEHLIALLCFQYFHIPLALRMLPVWDFLVEYLPVNLCLILARYFETLIVSIYEVEKYSIQENPDGYESFYPIYLHS